MRACGRKEIDTVKENIYGQMETIERETGKRTRKKESIYSTMLKMAQGFMLDIKMISRKK